MIFKITIHEFTQMTFKKFEEIWSDVLARKMMH